MAQMPGITPTTSADSGAQTSVNVDPSVAHGLPGAAERWRCAACGNLTRFDVVRTVTLREFWHLDLAGQPRIDETETLDHAVGSVGCRWCGRADAIEVVARPDGSPP